MNATIEEERHKQSLRVLETVKSIIMASNRRLEICKDPVSKNLMRVDRLAMIVDILVVGMSTAIGQEQDAICSGDEILAIIRKDLEELMEWVQHPVYSPDHPVGAQLMNEAKNEFESK
jgi:hypothetical protein